MTINENIKNIVGGGYNNNNICLERGSEYIEPPILLNWCCFDGWWFRIMMKSEGVGGGVSGTKLEGMIDEIVVCGYTAKLIVFTELPQCNLSRLKRIQSISHL